MAGYAAPSYGYLKPQRPRQPAPAQPARSLALAAAAGPSQVDPFGLGHEISPAPGRFTPVPPSKAAAAVHATVAAPPPPGSVAGTSGSRANTAPTPMAYDINTDPAFAEETSLLGQSDEGARASALKAKSDILLGYGDPTLAGALGDPALAQAAAQNPTSTLAQLSSQRDRNTHDLTENLNKANLLYGGYRVTQEEQAAQDYQNQLASAAAAVNGNLGAVDSNLASALGSNQAQKIAAMQAAEALHQGDTGPLVDPTLRGGATDHTGATVTGDQSGAGDLTGTAAPDLNAIIAQALRQRAGGGGGGIHRTA